MRTHNFVEIETLYTSIENRTIDKLSDVYRDKKRLRDVVHRLMEKHFEASDIKGKSILLKPNWVRHELKESDFVCLRTNDNLLLCILEEILLFHPSKVLIADAPVQGCIWDKMITIGFLQEIDYLSEKYTTPIIVKDLRRTVADLKNNKISREIHPISDYVIFNLGEESFLEPISTAKNRFRVTCYDPDRLSAVHHNGMHKYCIAKDVFEYDVIITIPKLKTHRMAGMTNALKLLVGINGDKDYLPHHRIGSLKEGGDNYKDRNMLRSIANHIVDEANRRIGTPLGSYLNKVGVGFWKLSKPDKATLMNAGWYGNDTIWRTVMDINKIALFGDREGVIHHNQQRRLYIIMDGVIGGQGDGPLHPDPSPLGVIAISDNPYLMDVVASQLYHLDYNRIPLLREAYRQVENVDYSVYVNSENTTFNDVPKYGIDIRMSPGWEDYKK